MYWGKDRKEGGGEGGGGAGGVLALPPLYGTGYAYEWLASGGLAPPELKGCGRFEAHV